MTKFWPTTFKQSVICAFWEVLKVVTVYIFLPFSPFWCMASWTMLWWLTLFLHHKLMTLSTSTLKTPQHLEALKKTKIWFLRLILYSRWFFCSVEHRLRYLIKIHLGSRAGLQGPWQLTLISGPLIRMAGPSPSPRGHRACLQTLPNRVVGAVAWQFQALRANVSRSWQCPEAWAWKLAECHFCHILLFKVGTYPAQIQGLGT